MVEKPLALDHSQLDDLQRRGARIFRVYQHRFGAERLLGMVDRPVEKAIASIWVNRPRTPEQVAGAWRSDRALAGGGILTHIGVHYLDLVALFLGQVVSSTVEQRSDYPSSLETRAAGIASFSGDNLCTFAVGCVHPNRADRIDIMSDRFRLSYDGESYGLDTAAGERVHHPVPPAAELRRRWYERLGRHLRAGGPEPLLDPHLSLPSHRILAGHRPHA